MSPITVSETGPFKLFTLINASGMSVVISDLGGIVQSIVVPDRNGELADVVLGFGELQRYFKLQDRAYFGAIIGRYGNRIAGGRFTIDGRKFQLATNNGPNHLHGGVTGFDQVVWSASCSSEDGWNQLKLHYVSPDGEEGFPGNLATTVTYRLTDENELLVEYHATTDQPTHVNLTQHSYFNLAGEGQGDVLDHELFIDADYFTPVDETSIPTGELTEVAGGPFDFRDAKKIGRDIDAEHKQLDIGSGYDHNWVINGASGTQRHAATAIAESTGRKLEVFTTEPGIQFYTGNFLDGRFVGKSGVAYGSRSGFCLETQHFPDSPNQQQFPSTLLRPGEQYQSSTMFRFSTT